MWIIGKAGGLICFAVLILTFIAGNSLASEPMIYPAKGQSNEQMEKDKYECYQWAKSQSGFDPMAVPTASTPPPAQQNTGGGALRGAVGGAAVGLTVGAITNNSKSRSTAAGAASGALIGGMSRRKQVAQQEQKQAQWEQQEVQKYAEQRNSYNRAFSACMQGREYTLN